MAFTEVVSAVVSGETVDGTQYVISGGETNSTLISGYYGVQYISSGGVANTTVINCGMQYISSGGVANTTTINDGSTQSINSGGAANFTTINSGGGQNIYKGTANSTIINSGGRQTIYSGSVSFTTINSGGFQDVGDASVANSTTIFGGEQRIDSGVANETTVNADGWQYVGRDGVANNTIINSWGQQLLISGGVANGTIINSEGMQYVSNGGVANDTIINYAGVQEVISSVVFSTILDGGGQSVLQGGIANNTTINSDGGQYVSGGVASSTTVNSGGEQYIDVGGSAVITTINSGGSQFVEGVADSSTVESGGVMMIVYGGAVNDLTVASGGIFGWDFNTVINGTSAGEAISGSAETSYNFYLERANQTVLSGYTANSTTIDLVSNQYISSGGTTNNVLIRNHGSQHIFSGGVANSTSIYDMGAQYVYSGGVANATVIDSWGRQVIYAGGVANFATINTMDGTQYISSGGIASSTIVNSGGLQVAYFGGNASDTTVNSGGSMHISSGGVASSTIVNSSGIQVILSGGTASDITVNYGGSGNINSGGILAGTMTIAGGDVYISNSSAVDSLTTISYELENAQTNDVLLTVTNGILGSGGTTYSLSLDDAALGTYILCYGYLDDMSGKAFSVTDNGQTVSVTVGSSYTFANGEILSLEISEDYKDYLLATFSVESTPPSDPASLSAEVAANDVALDWNDCTDDFGVSSYTVEYSTAAGFTGAVSVSISVSELDLTDLADGIYHWRVKSVDSNGNESGWTSGSDFTVDITAPNAPTGLSGNASGTDAALDWAAAADNVTGIKEYIVEYADNAQFSNANSQTVDSSNLDVSGLTDLTTYYWRVKAVDNNDNASGWSATATFDIDNVASSDPVGLDADVTGNDVSLDWEDATDNLSGVAGYTVEYTTEAGFGSASSQTAAVSELDLSGLADGVYHWRVKSADNNGNESAWVEGADFTVDTTAPAAPGGLADSVTGDSASLDWVDSSDNVTGIKEYVIEYAGNDQFTGASSQTVVASELDLTSLSDGTYYWRVKVIDNNDNASEWSVAETFDIDTTASSDPTGLDAAVTGNDVSLDWTDSTDNLSGVAGYTVEYTTDADFGSASSQTAAVSELDLAGLVDGVYHWRVKSVDDNGNESAWTDGTDFTVDTTAPTTPGGLADSVTVNSASLDWDDSSDNVTGIKEYVVEYADNDLFTGAGSQTVVSSELDLTSLSDGSYYWRVKVIDNNGNESGWSAAETFEIDTTASSEPTGLDAAVTGNDVSLDWADSTDNLSGLAGYTVEYTIDADFGSAYSQTVSVSELDLSDLTDGVYHWRVKSVDDNGNESGWTGGADFTVDITAPDVPSSLDAAVIGDDVSLDWAEANDNLTGTKEYVIEYTTESDFDSASSQTVSVSELDLSDLPDGVYHWRVKSVDENSNESAWTGGADFTVDITAPDVPSSLDAAVIGDDVSLDWAEANDNLTGTKEYVIEYTTESDFDSASSQTVSVSELDLADLPDGVYHWRVKSVDENSNESAWIEGADFTVDTTAPATPDGLSGSVNGDSASLDWADSIDNVTGIKEYVVEYADNDQFTGASSQTVASSELDLTSLSDGYYYWRVKVIDNNDNDSGWSETAAFDVDTTASGEPDTLNATVTGNSVSLDWADALDNFSGVAGYTVEYTTEADFSSASSRIVDISDLDLSGLADGVYHWRVKSVDNNGNESAWTTGADFTIDVTAPDAPSSLDAVVTGNDAALDWQDALDNLTGIDEYIVEYSINADFSDADIESTTGSSLDLAGLADGVYYWRVKTVDGSGNASGWSDGNDFLIDVTAPTTPDNLVETLQGSDIVLDWDDASDNLSGIQSYLVEYADNAEFDNAVSQAVNDSVLNISDLSYGTWFWRVSAVDNFANQSEWSSLGTFDTGDTSGNTHDQAKSINVDEAYHYDEYVGQGDACDMYSFDIVTAGKFDLSISNLSAKAKLNIYVWNGKKYKKIKSASSKFNKRTGQIEAHIDNLKLAEDTYYVEVMSGDKGKGKYNTEYSLDITPSYFPEATDNNSWENATEIALDFNMADGYVGFGDAVDYYKFELGSLTSFDIDLTGNGKNAKLTIYEWNEDKGKLKKVTTASLKNGEALLDDISLDAGLYYVEVLSKDKGKGKYNTEYELDITVV